MKKAKPALTASTAGCAVGDVGCQPVAAPTSNQAALGKSLDLAKLSMGPCLNSAAVMMDYSRTVEGQDISAMVVALSQGIEGMWSGDMKQSEAMLYAQAHALQSIFMNLARKAQRQGLLKQWEAYLRMALKAQNQCRMTLETLATLKNPPVVFARQANINNGGQQQVNNNEPAPSMASPATNRQSGANEVLEAQLG